MSAGIVYYVDRLLSRVCGVSATKTGKLLRIDTNDGPVWAVNSEKNRRVLRARGWRI